MEYFSPHYGIFPSPLQNISLSAGKDLATRRQAEVLPPATEGDQGQVQQ